MRAPADTRSSCSRRLELHRSNFAARTYYFSCAEIGELFQMLMAEVGCQPIPETTNEYVAEAFAERRSYSRIRGSFGRINLPLAIRRFVFGRDGATCRYCKTPLTWDRYHCDHVHPVSKGGTSHPKNLAAACYECNLSKGAKTLKEWKGR